VPEHSSLSDTIRGDKEASLDRTDELPSMEKILDSLSCKEISTKRYQNSWGSQGMYFSSLSLQ
jgi:hypothetical protein